MCLLVCVVGALWGLVCSLMLSLVWSVDCVGLRLVGFCGLIVVLMLFGFGLGFLLLPVCACSWFWGLVCFLGLAVGGACHFGWCVSCVFVPWGWCGWVC